MEMIFFCMATFGLGLSVQSLFSIPVSIRLIKSGDVAGYIVPLSIFTGILLSSFSISWLSHHA